MPTKTTQQDKLEMLKDLLFPGEQEAFEDVLRRVKLLEKVIEAQKKITAQIDPLIDKKLEIHHQNLQNSLGPALYSTLEKEIQTNPEAMAALLAPLMSTLIRQHRSQRRKKFLYSLNAPFRYLERARLNVSSRFKGGSDEQLLQNQLKSAVIEQVLLIDRKTGNLRACYSETKNIDAAKISVICGIINDYIQKNSMKKDQHLESIPYKRYQIHVQGFVKHHVALVISGKNKLRGREKLQDIIFNFYYKYMTANLDLLKEVQNPENSKRTIDRDLLKNAMDESFGNTSP